jgi:hypothetical protein
VGQKTSHANRFDTRVVFRVPLHLSDGSKELSDDTDDVGLVVRCRHWLCGQCMRGRLEKNGRRNHEKELDDAELKWKADENEPAHVCTVNKELDEKTPCRSRH